MYSTHEAELDLPTLPLAARRVHIVPALHTASLLSMGQLCDAGCTVTFDATTVQVHRNTALLLAGVRTPATGLWHLSLVAPPSTPCEPDLLHQSYSAVHSATPADLVAFAHASLFSPALSTLKLALERGYLPNFMGLTAKELSAHPPTSVAMVKGHMDQDRKNKTLQSPKLSRLQRSLLTRRLTMPAMRFLPATPLTREPIIVSPLYALPLPVKFTPIKPAALSLHPTVATTTFSSYTIMIETASSLKIFVIAPAPASWQATKFSTQDLSPPGYDPNSNVSTTNVRPRSNNTSLPNKLIISSCLRIFTVAMQLNVPSARSKIILLPASAALIKIFHYTCGTSSCLKLK